MPRLKHCYTQKDIEALARKRLPWGMWEFLYGGADDEWCLTNNRRAFEHYELMPRACVDVSNIDLTTSVMGMDLEWPVMLSPTGMNRMYHGSGEIGAARAALKTGTVYSLSTYSSYSIEQVAETNPGNKIFQLFINPGIERSFELIDRAKISGYQALCLTVDTTASPNKERDYKTGIAFGGVTPKSLLSILAHPRWIYGLVTGGSLQLANLGISPLEADKFQWKHATQLNWELVKKIRDHWQGPFALKGLLNPEDAITARQIGVDGIIISNHGGRQMDGVPAPVSLIREFVDATNNEVDIIIDSGIRRGSDVIKALALGAKACMIGRPYLYGLAAAGEAGATKAIDILKAELLRDMTLLGLTAINDISPQTIRTGPNQG